MTMKSLFKRLFDVSKRFCGRRALTALGAAMLACGAAADTWKDSKGVVWHYEIYNGEAELINNEYGSFMPVIPDTTRGAITIPSKLGGCPVTAIGEAAFAFCSKLTSVTIPSGVKMIEWEAFRGCSALKSISIPSTVTDIYAFAFDDCEALESVTIPAGMTILDDGLFSGCRSLKSVRIPDNVRSIGEHTFAYCDSLTEVWIPRSVETITILAFFDAPITKIHVASGDKARIQELLEESGFDTDDVTFVQDMTPAKYTVCFHKYDGSGETRTQTLVVGKEQSLLWLDSQLGWKRDGYQFIGWVPWNPDSKQRLCKYVNGEKVKYLGLAGSTVHLYAGWKSPSSYRVCFHYNHSDLVEDYDFTMNQVILRNKEDRLAWMDSQIGWTGRDNPFPEYIFLGWTDKPDGVEVKYKNGAKVKNLAMDGGTKHLYAKWRFAGAVKYVIRYSKYDGSGETMDQIAWEDEPTRLLWMSSQLGWSRDGYEFAGWAPWKPSGKPRLCKYVNGAVVENLTIEVEPVLDEDLGEVATLYAVWKSPSSYRVAIHKNDGGEDERMDQIILRNTDDKLAWMSSQIGWSREGYTFRGWTDAKNSTTVKFQNGASVRNLVSNGGTKHLYAVWRKD